MDTEDTNKTLFENEKRFRELVESLPETIFETDEKGNITFESLNGLDKFGYTRKDLDAGLSLYQLMAPEDRERVRESFKNALRGGKMGNEYTASRKDGTTFPVIIFASPIMSDDKAIGLRGIIADITGQKMTEIALKESRYRYKTLFECANDAIFILKDGIFVDCNSKTLVMFGCSRDQIVGQPPYAFSPPTQPDGRNSKEKALEMINNAILDKPQLFEWKYCRYDRTEFDAEVSLNAIELSDEIFIHAFVRDITARREAKTLLHAREQQLRLIIDATPGLIAYVDKDQRYRFINKTWETWYGKKEDEIIGKHVWEVIGAEYHTAIERYIIEALAGKTVTYEGERSGQASKYRYISGAFVPDIDDSGEVKGIYVLITDITERRQMEEALRESERKYRNIFENSVEGIFCITPEGRYIMANPARAKMYGYDTPEELMENITDVGQLFVNPEERVKLKGILEEKGFVTEFESQRYRKDGSIMWVSSNVRVVKDKNGKILYHEGTATDITERKQAEDALKKSMEKLRKATGGIIDVIAMAVEIRDPYTAGHQRRVANLARTIAKEMELPQNQIDCVRMAGVIHDLGKISIPAEILSTPRKLTATEFNLIKEHPLTGYTILKDIEFPWPIANIVLQHHERINGSGYPSGIRNGEISLEAKILSVSDVVEAIASHRPYRAALGLDAALEEIEKNKGILYDTEVVDLCLKLFREKGFKFE